MVEWLCAIPHVNMGKNSHLAVLNSWTLVKEATPLLFNILKFCIKYRTI